MWDPPNAINKYHLHPFADYLYSPTYSFGRFLLGLTTLLICWDSLSFLKQWLNIYAMKTPLASKKME